MAKAHNVVNWRNTNQRAVLLLGALILGCFSALLSPAAHAANRVVWKRTTIQEESDSWKIALEVHLDRAPDVALLPVRFSFTPVVHFENALVDGRKDPVIRKVPLEHQQPIVESVDVGFLDPGTGKTAKRTRFSFVVTRDHGFEAGQYEVKVTDARSGKDFGAATTLTLDGKNKPVDRRSVVFDDSQAKAKKQDQPAAAAAPEEKQLTPEDDEFWAGGPKEPVEKESPLPPPAHMQERPGCGCRVAGDVNGGSGALVCALAALVWMRRRSASRAFAAG